MMRRQEVVNYMPPPKDSGLPTLAGMLKEKDQDYKRLIGGANAGVGAPWDGLLELLAKMNPATAGHRKEDMYMLAGANVSDDWSVSLGRLMFGQTMEDLEAMGWPRSGKPLGMAIKAVGYCFDVMCEGVKILREWGVFKPANKIKGRVDLHVEWATEEAMGAFGRVGGFLQYTRWMKELAMSEESKGNHVNRVFYDQAQVCRKKGDWKTGGKDTYQAGLRKVIWWLQWCFGFPPVYTTVKQLVGNIPDAKLLRGKVQMALKDTLVYGGVHEREDMEKMGWNVDDECKLGAPMERDCRGVIPSAFATTLKAHRYVPRSERCVKMDLPDNAPALPTATGKTATKQTGTQKGGENLERPTVVSKLSTHVLVKDEDKFVVPKHAEVVTGFEKLLIQDKGSFDKAKAGLELVLFTVPLPKCELLVNCGPTPFDYKESMKTLKANVKVTVELGANLLTPSGAMIVIAPLGLPEEWLTGGEQEGSTSNGAGKRTKDGEGGSPKAPREKEDPGAVRPGHPEARQGGGEEFI
jgi:hypothetical protein